MRRLLILAAVTSLTACASSPPRLWEKEGATPQTTTADLVECRRAARQEAFYETSNLGFGGYSRFGPIPYYAYRRGPYFGPRPFYRRGPYFWGYWGAPDVEFNQQSRLSAFCMRNKGYELVTLPPAPGQVPTVAPGIVPPSAPDVPPPVPAHD
jgi:hypothetical protein